MTCPRVAMRMACDECGYPYSEAAIDTDYRVPHKGATMTEWYVYMENGVPKEVILGRRDALDRLTHNFRLTTDEKRRLGYVRESMPDLGRAIHLVGYELGHDSKMPDRAIMRVVGPGTEV